MNSNTIPITTNNNENNDKVELDPDLDLHLEEKRNLEATLRSIERLILNHLMETEERPEDPLSARTRKTIHNRRFFLKSQSSQPFIIRDHHPLSILFDIMFKGNLLKEKSTFQFYIYIIIILIGRYYRVGGH